MAIKCKSKFGQTALQNSKQKKTIPTEHQEQAAFVQWFRLQFPNIRIISIPNGVRTGFKQAIKAKKEGLSKGVPDLYAPQLKMWIEMKRTKGSVTSPEQKDWHHYLVEHCGDTVILAMGCEDAVKQVMQAIKNCDLK